MSKKIKQLPNNSNLNSNNLFLMWANGETVNSSLTDVTEYITNNLILDREIPNKWYIPYGSTITVEPYSQYFLYGNLYVEGTLFLEDNSQLVVLNGDVILSGGTISGNGSTVLVEIPIGDKYTTGVRLSGTTLYFDRSDMDDAYSVDLSYFKFTGNTAPTNIDTIYVSNLLSPNVLTLNGKIKQSTNTVNGTNSIAFGTNSTASGNNSFIHSTNSTVSGDRSIVLGGQGITGSDNDTVYVPNLNISNTPTYDNTITDILARDADGTIRIREAATLGKALSGNRMVVVDLLYGDDSTGSIFRIDLPFKTVNAARLALESIYPSTAYNGLIYLRPGTYDEVCYFSNNIYYYADNGVVFSGGGFYDTSTSVMSGLFGNASFVSNACPAIVNYGSRLVIEFNSANVSGDNGFLNVNNTTITSSDITYTANELVSQNYNYGATINGLSSVKMKVYKSISSDYTMFNVSQTSGGTSHSGSIFIESPKIILSDGGISGNTINKKQILNIDYTTSTSNINIKSNLYSNVVDPMDDFSSGLITTTENSNSNISFYGDMTSTSQTHCIRLSGSTKMNFNGTIYGTSSLFQVDGYSNLNIKSSKLLRYSNNVYSPFTLTSSPTVYISNTTYYSQYNNGNMIDVFSTGVSIYMNNVSAQGVGTGYFVNTNGLSSTVGMIGVVSNKGNDPAIVNPYSFGGFTLEPNINVSYFM